MTTRLSTGKGDGDAPSWLPDEATLTRLATDSYGTMPGHAPRPPSSAGSSADEHPVPPGIGPGELVPPLVATGYPAAGEEPAPGERLATGNAESATRDAESPTRDAEND